MISSLFFVIEIEKAIWILKWRGKVISPKNFQLFPKTTSPICLVKIDSASLALHHTKELNC